MNNKYGCKRLKKMKSIIITLAVILFNSNTNAQSKGATPQSIINHQPSTNSSTHAIVIGISDYQDKDIPDLQFADRDAMEFTEWLESPAGGNVPPSNILTLTNQKATNASIAIALTNLPDECKPNDHVIIYFSGHGDVATKFRNQPGYILAYDTPANVYMSLATSLHDLQEVVNTLTEKKCHVLLITDVCHSGKLAGNQINGTQITNNNLAKSFSADSKILSCQPNEFAMEGKQWGGGRGVFSYHLIEGLTGLADQNNDGKISLIEIDRYLGDKVTLETNNLQTPITSGDRNAIIAHVDSSSLLALKESHKNKMPSLEQLTTKGIEEDILAKVDSITREMYHSFKSGIVNHILLEPKDSCAWSYFNVLLKNQQLSPLFKIMRNNLAVALLDEVQQALNALLANDPYESNQWYYNPLKYNQYPILLERARELLDAKHPMQRSLLAKQRYFEGYNLYRNASLLQEDLRLRDSLKAASKQKFLESIQIEPEAAYPYFGIASLYYRDNPIHSDSMEYWNSLAIERAPKWLLPYVETGLEWNFTSSNLDKAAIWLTRAYEMEPDSWISLSRYSDLKDWQGRSDESLELLNKMLKLRPDLSEITFSKILRVLVISKGEYQIASKLIDTNKALLSGLTDEEVYVSSILYQRTRRTQQAIDKCLKVVNSPKFSFHDKGTAISELIRAYVQLRQFNNAKKYIRLEDSLNIGDQVSRTTTKLAEGRMYYLLGNYNKAKVILEKALLIDPTDNTDWMNIWALLGDIASKEGEDSKAVNYYLKAIHCYKPLPYSTFRDEAYFRYLRYLIKKNEHAKAISLMDELRKMLPNSYYYGMGMALIFASEGRGDEALNWLEVSLKNYWPDEDEIENEPLFDIFKKTNRFKNLMKYYYH